MTALSQQRLHEEDGRITGNEIEDVACEQSRARGVGGSG